MSCFDFGLGEKNKVKWERTNHYSIFPLNSYINENLAGRVLFVHLIAFINILVQLTNTI